MHKCNTLSSMKIDKYIQQLENIANQCDIRLIDMFTHAGIPTSTYYRAKNGVDLRFDTAERVANAFRDVQLQSQASTSRS